MGDPAKVFDGDAQLNRQVMSAHIAWIGVGKMGLPMCRHLIASGYAIAAFDPSNAARENARAIGARVYGSIRETASSGEWVFASVPDDRALMEIVSGRDGIKAAAKKSGAVFIDTSTVSPAASAQVAKVLHEAGIYYLRAPLSGSVVSAENRQLTALVSGPEAQYRRIEPLLACFCAKQFYLGAAEEARTMKLVLNIMVALSGAMLAEAAVLGERGGLDLEKMLQVIDSSALASPFIKYKTSLLREQAYPAAFTCAQMLKDLSLIETAAAETGAVLPTTALATRLFERALHDGYGELDLMAVKRVIERA